MIPADKWAVDYQPDLFDSAESRLAIIDASEHCLTHPQGPMTIASVNVRAFAPHMEEAEKIARLLAAAPELLAALDQLQANPNDPRAHRAALDAMRKAKGAQ